MSLNKIDHIGIAVTDLDKSIDLYKAMGFEFHGTEVVEDQKVKTAFFKIGESMIELLAATDPASPIAKFIEKNGQKGGIAHMAINVSDVDAKLAELKQKGFQLIDETAKPGAHGAKIAFVHPKSTGGVLLELCEKKDH
jgi:methylmalonyl-CoA/ethylmalonyl-CoA epimerase